MQKPKQKWEAAKTKAQIEYMYVKAKVRKAKEWSYYCMKSTLHSRLCNFTLSPSLFFYCIQQVSVNCIQFDAGNVLAQGLVINSRGDDLRLGPNTFHFRFARVTS